MTECSCKWVPRAQVQYALIWLISAVSLASGANDAIACACCVEPGTRSETIKSLESHDLELLGSLHIASTARLHTTVASPDDIKGLTPAESDLYSIELTRKNLIWRFELKDDGGRSGSLSFRLPEKLERFEVDFRGATPIDQDDEDVRLGMTNLVKEWRMTTRVNGDGMFEAGIAQGTKMRLILQGSGNGCAHPNDFTFWQILVDGPKAGFSFWGRLKPSSPE